MTQNAKNIILFLLVLLVAGAIVAWVTLINKGTLQVTAPAPFSVTVSGGQGTFDANENPLKVKLKPGDYTLSITKDDHFPLSESVSIERFKTTELTEQFIRIPRLSAGSDFVIPAFTENIAAVDHNLYALNLTMDPAYIPSVLARLGDASFGRISPSGSHLFTYKDDTAHVYTTSTNAETIEISMVGFVTAVWSQDGSKLYIMHTDREHDKQVISILDVKKGTRTVATSFHRPFEKGDMWITEDGTALAIAEHLEKETNMYRLGLDGLRKTKLFTTGTVEHFLWSPDGSRALYQVNSPKGYPILFEWTTPGQPGTQLSIPVPLTLISWINNQSIVTSANFIVEEYLLQQNKDVSGVFANKLDIVTGGSEILEKSTLLHYDFSTQTWRRFLYKDDTPEGLSRIYIDRAAGMVYLHANDKRYSFKLLSS